MFFKTNSNVLSHKEAKEIMDSRKVVILDVRTPQEYSSGHIKKAINVELRDIPKTIQTVIKDQEQEILVYCLTGARSRLATRALGKLGYTNVSDFGGINGWPY